MVIVVKRNRRCVTAILLRVDPAMGTGEYVNAGHNECVLLRGNDGEMEFLRSTGLPLGIMPNDTLTLLGKAYETGSFFLRPGDALALYSDGVPEAFDEQEQEWGDDRLQACLRDAQNESARTIIERMSAQITSFTGSAPQHDDITLLIFKRAEGEASGAGDDLRPPSEMARRASAAA